MIIALIALASTPVVIDKPNWEEHVYASGDTRRIRPVEVKVARRDNGLGSIIARIKREHKIKG